MGKLEQLLTDIATKNNEVAVFWDEHSDDDLTSEQLAEVKQKNQAIEEMEKRLRDAQDVAGMRAATEQRTQKYDKPAGVVHPNGDSGAKSGQIKTLANQFLDSDEFKGWLKAVAPHGHFPQGMHVNTPPVSFENFHLGMLGGAKVTGYTHYDEKALITGLSDTLAGAFVTTDRQPYVDLALGRPLVIRDMMTTGQTTSDTVDFVRTGVNTNAAAPVAEATTVSDGAKPESAMLFTTLVTTVKTIAHWIPVTKRALADAGQIRTYIDAFLRYGLEEELEDQIVNGDGVGENFLGIEDTVGTTSQAWDTDLLTTTRKARTKVKTVGRATPNAYLLHPTEWERLDLLQDNENRYYFGGPSVVGNARLWGLPVVESEAVVAGMGFVADFKTCVLWDRQQATITATDSHADFFIRNLVAILAELRAAFSVLRPAAIVEMDLSA